MAAMLAMMQIQSASGTHRLLEKEETGERILPNAKGEEKESLEKKEASRRTFGLSGGHKFGTADQVTEEQ